MKAYLMEGIGTFFLVLIIALTGQPLAIGIALAVLVYMGGAISGAHFNPAVTFALFLRKKINQYDTIRYMVAQMLGGVSAALVASLIFNKPLTVAPTSDISWMSAAIAEAIFTFLLITVIFQVAVNKKTANNQYFGFAIGGTVLASATAIGGISGGALNPTVGLSPLIANVLTGTALFNPSLFFLYIIGPSVGAVMAYLFNTLLSPDNN